MMNKKFQISFYKNIIIDSGSWLDFCQKNSPYIRLVQKFFFFSAVIMKLHVPLGWKYMPQFLEI